MRPQRISVTVFGSDRVEWL